MVVFSDVHHSSEMPTTDSKLTQYSIALVDRLVTMCNEEIKPDVVVCLGDLIDDKCQKQEDAKSIQYVIEHIQRATAPTHILAGNHDLRPYDSQEELAEIMGHEATYSFDINGYHFVVLGISVSDPSIKDAYGIARSHYLSQKDLEWLESDLEGNTLPTIILSHYSIGHDDMSLNKWFKKEPEDVAFKNRDDIQNILHKHDNIIALFNGHQHWTKSMIEGGIPYYTIGSLPENINGDGVPDGVYYIVDIEDNNIHVIDRHIRL